MKIGETFDHERAAVPYTEAELDRLERAARQGAEGEPWFGSAMRELRLHATIKALRSAAEKGAQRR